MVSSAATSPTASTDALPTSPVAPPIRAPLLDESVGQSKAQEHRNVNITSRPPSAKLAGAVSECDAGSLTSARSPAKQTSAGVERVDNRDSSNSENDEGPEFVGHLNPEGIFLATTRRSTSQAVIHEDRLGYWLQKISCQGRKDGAGPLARVQAVTLSTANQDSVREAAVPNVNRRRRLLPDLESFRSLKAIYLQEIHPLFPILQPAMFTVLEVSDTLSLAETILIQCVCLAVAGSASARPFLRFQGRRNLSTPRIFASRFSQELVTATHMSRSVDRLLRVRVLTILSMFSQLTSNNHNAAEYCARAVSHVHTLQLHLDTRQVRNDDANVTQVFLCVWMLDRLNAAFQSRPVLIHSRDIGRDMTASIAGQERCFRALLMTCDLLEEVTDLYRPFNESHASIDPFVLPSFEDLVVNADAVRCPVRLMATIETLYHAVCMLSYRSQEWENPDRFSVSYFRSNLSAVRLIAILNAGTALGTRISSLPFIPYAISLALRVSYRELRISKTPFQRSMAQGQLLVVCSLLRKYSDSYGFAQRLADLATKAVRELDKFAASALQARHSDQNASAPGSVAQEGQSSKMDNASTTLSSNSRMPSSNTSSASGALRISQFDAAQYHTESFDLLHKIPDLVDPFEYFDPDFNLDAIDLALMDNIQTEALDFDSSPVMDGISETGASNTLLNKFGDYVPSQEIGPVQVS